MSEESAYFARRATESQRASSAAVDSSARIAHAQLATQYRRLSDTHEAMPDGKATAIAISTNEGGHV